MGRDGRRVRTVGRRSPRAVLLLCLALALAMGAPPAAAAARIVPFETRAVDGTALRGDVYLPAARAPLATVLELSPYWNTVKGPSESQAGSEAVKPFLDAGFAVALVNLRGTGESSGCFQWGSRLDWSDASTVIRALAAQRWSNGNVGMYGTSYEGWTQYMAMADPPPALKAAVPISGLIDLWSLLTRRGAPISVGPTASTQFGVLTSFVDPEPALLDHLRCTDYARHLARGLELITTGDRTPYYAERDLRPSIAKSRVPVLMANGLRYFDEGHVLQFEGLWELLRADRTRFMLGQWGHGGKRADFNRLAVRWFDRYLRGGPEVVRPGIVEYQDDAGAWHTAPRWPPPSTPRALHLSGGELTADRAAVRPSRRSFLSLDLDVVADALDVVLESATGASPRSSGRLGPVCGPHQLLYVSPPLAQDVLVAGNLTADLTVSSSLPGGNLVATLYRARGGASCAELLGGAEDAGRIALDLRHWRQPGRSRPFPVGVPTRVTAEGAPLASRVRAGERLVLAIGAGSLELLPDARKPRITIATGAGLTGSISLPVVAGTRLRFR